MNFSDFEQWLYSNECFENHDVSYIDIEGLQHYLDQTDYHAYIAKVGILIAEKNTIKVEQYEKVLKIVDKTAHVFYNQDNGPTFKLHQDPVDVIIECLDGEKDLEVRGARVTLNPGESLFIPANTKHRAINSKKALMISYGISDTETLSSIRKNN